MATGAGLVGDLAGASIAAAGSKPGSLIYMRAEHLSLRLAHKKKVAY